MEFLRFGSSIPGGHWGCCVCCIIQNFKVDPDAKASIELVSGDGGNPVMHPKGGSAFAGPTYRDIFWQRIRYGTFSNNDMPNHAFFAILSQNQLSSAYGKAWLAILKEAGFEFIRRVNNSVWNVDNYIFGLIRNVGTNAVKDQFTPPKVWSDLPTVVPEQWNGDDGLWTDPVEHTKEIAKAQKKIWDGIPKAVFLTEAEVVAAGAPVVMAGQRSKFPPQEKSARLAAQGKATAAPTPQLSLKAATA